MTSPRFRGYNLWQAALLICGESLSVSLWLFQSAHAGGQIVAFSVSALTLLFAYAVESTAVDTLVAKFKSVEMDTWRRVALVCLVIVFFPLLFAIYCGVVWYRVVRPFFTQPTTYRRISMCIAAFALPLFVLGTPMTFAAGSSSTPTRTANGASAMTARKATPTIDLAATASAAAFDATATANVVERNTLATAESQWTPTPIPATPTPIPTATLVSIGRPQVGTTLSDFIAKYGQPINPGSTGSINFYDYSSISGNNPPAIVGATLTNGIVTHVSVVADPTWDVVLTYDYCYNFLPSDAIMFNKDGQIYDYNTSLGVVVLDNLGQGQCMVYK